MAVSLCCVVLALSALAWATPDRPGHLEPLGRSGTVEPMHERVGFIPPKEFLNDYVLQNRPVLMRKALLDSPAIEKWNDAYLMERAKANAEAIVEVEYGKKETRLNGTKMPFTEFLSVYNSSDVYMVNGVPPYLEDDMIIPWPLQCEDYKRSFEDNVMWFSSGGTKSVIHHDGYENINCLIRGRKRFLFVNRTRYLEVENQIIDYENGTYGSVDVEKVDLDKYPVYQGMQFFSADVNPGDCLYSPLKWIHQVESWDSNIAVNMWWFSEINSVINTDLCAPNFDRSRTFQTVSFHKTAVLEGGVNNMDERIAAFRHSLARLVFKTAKKDSVGVKQFMRILTGNARNLSKMTTRYVVDLFRSLDTNGNRKFDVRDLDNDISENEAELLYADLVNWLSVARLDKYPEVVDLRSEESYQSVPDFSVNELAQDSTDFTAPSAKDAKKDVHGKPVLQDVEVGSLGERDEL